MIDGEVSGVRGQKLSYTVDVGYVCVAEQKDAEQATWR